MSAHVYGEITTGDESLVTQIASKGTLSYICVI